MESTKNVQARLFEVNELRSKLTSLLSGIGYSDGESLAFDLSEYFGACAAFSEKLRSILEDWGPDQDSLAADFATLGVDLADSEGHLKSLLQSVQSFVRFLSNS